MQSPSPSPGMSRTSANLLSGRQIYWLDEVVPEGQGFCAHSTIWDLISVSTLMKVPPSHVRRFFAPFWPFYVLSAAFGLVVEYGPKFLTNEAKCAIFEPVSIRITVLLFIFVVLASGLSLMCLGSIDRTSKNWRRVLALWFVRRPSLFLLDFLGPIFGICLGLATIAFATGYRAQSAALAFVSLYIPAIAFFNASVAGLTRQQGLLRAAALLKENRLASNPRLVGLYLVFCAAVLAWFALPIDPPNTGC